MKKLIIFILLLILIYFYFVGVSLTYFLPGLNSKIEESIFQKTNVKVVVDLVYLRFPNKIVLTATDVSASNQDIILSSCVMKKIILKLNFFELFTAIRTKKIMPSVFSKIVIGEMYLNIKHDFGQKQKTNLKTILERLSKSKIKIPTIKIKNIRVVNIADNDKFIHIDNFKFKNNSLKITIKPLRFFIGYDNSTDELKVNAKVLALRRIDDIHKKTLIFLNFFCLENRFVKKVSNLNGKIYFDLETKLKLSDSTELDLKRIEINGEIVSNNVGFQYKKYNIQNINQIAKITQNSYEIKDATAEFNEIQLRFDVAGENILRLPNNLKLQIQDFDITKIIKIPKIIKYKTVYAPVVFFNFKLDEYDGKYDGEVFVSESKAKIGDVFYKIEANKLKVENNILNVNDIVVDADEMGQLFLNGKICEDFYEFELLSKKEFVLDEVIKKYTAYDTLKTTNILFNINNKNEDSSFILNADIQFLLGNSVLEQKEKYKFNITKQEQVLDIKIIDENKKQILNAKAIVINDLVNIEWAYLNLFDKGKIKVNGNIPITKTKNFRLNVTGEKLKLSILDNFFQKVDLGMDFEIEAEGLLDDPFIRSRANIYNKTIKIDLLAEYEDKKFKLEHFVIDNMVNVMGEYDFLKKTGGFSTRLDGIEAGFFLRIAKIFQFIKVGLPDKVVNIFTTQLLFGTINFSKDSSDKRFNLDLKLYDTKNNFRIDVKSYSDKNILNIEKFDIFQYGDKKGGFSGYVDFPQFEQYDFKGNLKGLKINENNYSMNVNLEGKHGKGYLSIKDFNFAGYFLKKIEAKFFKKRNKLEILDLNIEDILTGKFKISDISNKQLLSGKLKIKDYIFDDSKIKFLNGQEVVLNTEINIEGSLKDPILKTNGLKVDIDKKFLLQTDLKYFDNKVNFDQGEFLYNGTKRIDFRGNIFSKDKSNFWINLKNVDKEFIEQFDVLDKYLKVSDISGGIYLSQNKKQFYTSMDIQLEGDNPKIWLFDVDSAKLRLTFDAENKKVLFHESKIYKDKQELEIYKTSFVKMKNRNDVDMDINFYMRDWRVVHLFNGLGIGRIMGNYKNDEFKGEFISDNFWFNKYNFRSRKIDFVYKNKELILRHDVLYARVLFEDDGIKIDDINYLFQEKNITKTLRIKGEILKNRHISFLGNAENIEFDTMARLLKFKFSLNGLSNFEVNVLGSLDDPQIRVEANLKNGRFLDSIDFDDAKCLVIIKKDLISLDSIELFAKNKYSIISKGIIPFVLIKTEENIEKVKRNSMTINIKTIDSNLGILNSFFGNNIIKPKGIFEADLTITNDFKNPNYNGFIKIFDGTMELTDVAKNVKNFDLQLDFKNSFVNISNLSANIGKGKLKVYGYFFLDRFRMDKFNINISVPSKKGISLELNSFKIPQNTVFKVFPSSSSKGALKGKLNFSGNKNEYLIKGDIDLSDANFTYPAKGNEKIQSGSEHGDFLKNAKLDVNFKIGNNTWFENKYVSLVVEGEMAIKTDDEKLKVNGDFQILRGDINFVSKHFKVNNGVFSMVDSEPFIELNAETYIQRHDENFNRTTDDVILLIVERSKLSDIKFRFESQNFPGTNSEEAMGLAFSGGFTESMSSLEKEEYMKQEFFRLIDANLATPFVRMLVQKTGLVDFVSVNTQFVQRTMEDRSSTSNLSPEQQNKNSNLLTGSSFVVGKYLNSKLFISYSLGLEESQFVEDENKLAFQHGVEARFKLGHNLYLKGLVEVDKASRREEQQLKVEYSLPFGKKTENKK